MTDTLTVTAHGEREIVMTRAFDARREVVFEALMRADRMRRWIYGPEEWPTEVGQNDPLAGSALRLAWRHRDGQTMGLSGAYREVTPPARIVHTELFDEDWTGGEALVTTILTERAGRTTMTMTILYQTDNYYS